MSPFAIVAHSHSERWWWIIFSHVLLELSSLTENKELNALLCAFSFKRANQPVFFSFVFFISGSHCKFILNACNLYFQ
jgi:hypothetical protein